MDNLFKTLKNSFGLGTPIVQPVPQSQSLVGAQARAQKLVQLLQAIGQMGAQVPSANSSVAQAKKSPGQQYNPQQQPQGGNYGSGYAMGTPNQYDAIIAQASKQYGVPASLLSSLLLHESHFNPNAKSPAGALGIAQFMPGTAKALGIDPLNPNQAIPGAANYLQQKYNEFNHNWNNALAAYNAGSGAVHQYGGIPPYKETQDYVRNITHDANFTYGGQ